MRSVLPLVPLAACLLLTPAAAAATLPCARDASLRTGSDILLAIGTTPGLDNPALCRFRRLGDGFNVDTYRGMRDVPLGELRSNAPVRQQLLESLDEVIKGTERSVTVRYLPPTDPLKPALFPAEITFTEEVSEPFDLGGREIMGRVFTLRIIEPQPLLAISTEPKSTLRAVGKEYRYVLHPDCAVVLLRQDRRLPAVGEAPGFKGGERVLAAEGLSCNGAEATP